MDSGDTVTLHSFMSAYEVPIKDIPEGFVSCVKCGLSCSACCGIPTTIGGAIQGRIPFKDGQGPFDLICN